MFAVSAGAWQAAGIVVVAVVTGTVTYLVSRRTTRGTPATSTAGELWTAAEQLRAELRAEVLALRDRVAVLEARVEELVARGR
jgi:hypothetical protein